MCIRDSRIASRPAGWNNGDTVYRPYIRQHVEENRMSCLMECRDTLFFIGYDPALFLGADPYFDEGSLNLSLIHIFYGFLVQLDLQYLLRS